MTGRIFFTSPDGELLSRRSRNRFFTDGFILQVPKITKPEEAMEHLRYPNESSEYRAARTALLHDEISLRAQIEAVAARRRALPPGGEVPEDYVFERIGKNATPEKV